MEILQGIREQRQFEQVRRFLKPFRYTEGVKAEELALATTIYRTCRSKGKTIRKSIDCIIAAHAILDQHVLFSLDRDFVQISVVFPQLLLF
jgi:predicted nucleic acid-binding protein